MGHVLQSAIVLVILLFPCLADVWVLYPEHFGLSLSRLVEYYRQRNQSKTSAPSQMQWCAAGGVEP